LPPEAARVAARRGVLIHRLLERLPELAPEGRGAAAEAWLARTATHLPPADRAEIAAAAIGALRSLLAEGRARELVIARVDGEPVARSRCYDALLRAGFSQGYRGLVMRKDRAGAMIA
jgi:ATP-dependent helicase/nuclease subunit A